MLRSLDDTRQAYYDRYRFAEVFAPVKRAPDRLMRDVAAIPGVARAEGRISAAALVDVPGFAEPITGRAISLPDLGDPVLNRVYLRRGRLMEPFHEDEVVLLESFANAHGLQPGDTIAATMNGKKRTLEIVGLALSPEFIYTIAPGELVPDDRRFGVFWMGREALGAAFDLDGAFNEALLKLSLGADERDVTARLDRLREPYGATGAFLRADQISDKFLSSELEQLKTMAAVMPPIFLGVAAFLLNIVVARMVEAKREQIGLLKAFGYTDLTVAGHYMKLVMVTAAVGALIGCGLGTWLGRWMALMYKDWFKFPFLLYEPRADVFAIGMGIALASAAVGVLFAVRRAATLTPAVAMRPPVPPDFSHTGRRGLLGWRGMDQPSRMILRQIVRRPVKATLTCTGIAFASAILLLAQFQVDAIHFMIDVSFGVADRQDLTVTFAEPQGMKTVYELRRLDGVIAAEPFRAVATRMKSRHVERREALQGVVRNADLSRPIDSDLRPIDLPPYGVLLSKKLAELLIAAPGDTLVVDVLEGRQPTVDVQVAGIAETYLGTPAYMNLTALNRTLDEGLRVSGAHLNVDPAKTSALYRELKDMPVVAGVTIREASKRSFTETLDETIGTFNAIFTVFACMIAIGVVYNSARIALAERRRELASLRVLGFTRGEAGYILLGELVLLTLVALPLGAALGYMLCWYLVQSLSTELYQVPLVIAPASYGYTSVVVLVATAVSSFLTARDVRHLDLVEALKTRE